MPIHFRWGDNSHTYTICVIEDRWTWEELHHIREQFEQMREVEGHPIHMIVDLSRCNYLPPNTLSHSLTFFKSTAFTEGMAIMVGANSLMRTVNGVMRKMGNSLAHRMVFVQTLDEALMLVQGSAAC